jgi:hypothetical protein
VPVLASVAAILRAMWPDLPTPETMMRPWQARISSTARGKGAVQAIDQAGDGLRLDAQHLLCQVQRLGIDLFVGRGLVHEFDMVKLEGKYTKLPC